MAPKVGLAGAGLRRGSRRWRADYTVLQRLRRNALCHDSWKLRLQHAGHNTIGTPYAPAKIRANRLQSVTLGKFYMSFTLRNTMDDMKNGISLLL